jgi:hypothetical protein
MVLALDTLSGKNDVFKTQIGLNLSQILAIVFIICSFYGIFRIMNVMGKKNKKVILSDTSN